MTGNDPNPTVPGDGPDRPAPSLADQERAQAATRALSEPLTSDPAPRTQADPALTSPRLGGGISLIVAFLGLVGAAVGTGWGWLDGRVGFSPEGLWGGILTLIAAALTVLGLLLLVGGLGYYVLAPAFGPREAAWRGVGSHRLVIATTLLILVLANIGPVLYVAI